MDGIICELFGGDRNFLFTLDTTPLGYAIARHRLRSDRSGRGGIARGFMQMGELRAGIRFMMISVTKDRELDSD